jgi:hypothetical protein
MCFVLLADGGGQIQLSRLLERGADACQLAVCATQAHEGRCKQGDPAIRIVIVVRLSCKLSHVTCIASVNVRHQYPCPINASSFTLSLLLPSNLTKSPPSTHRNTNLIQILTLFPSSLLLFLLPSSHLLFLLSLLRLKRNNNNEKCLVSCAVLHHVSDRVRTMRQQERG